MIRIYAFIKNNGTPWLFPGLKPFPWAQKFLHRYLTWNMGPLKLNVFLLKVWNMYFHDQAFTLAVFLQAEETRGSKLWNKILVYNYIIYNPGHPCQFSFENRFFEKESTSSEPAIFGVPWVVTNWGGSMAYYFPSSASQTHKINQL